MRINKQINTKYMRLHLEITTIDGQTHSLFSDYGFDIEIDEAIWALKQALMEKEEELKPHFSSDVKEQK